MHAILLVHMQYICWDHGYNLQHVTHFLSLVLLLKVDKYIRKLDTDLSRFEQELQLKDANSGHPSVSSASDGPGTSQPGICLWVASNASAKVY